MAAIKWFKLPVSENEKKSFAYFYETKMGEFDLQYDWEEFSSGMHKTLESAIEDFRIRLQAKRDRENQGVRVTVGSPCSVLESEAQRAGSSFRSPVAPIVEPGIILK